MKNSGVKWIGAVPNSWSVVQLKRYVQVVSGKEIVNELDEDAPEAIPVYGSGGIFKYTDRVQYDGEVVLFGRKGTIGKPIYANHKFWAVDTMYFLKHNSNCLCPKFNYYQLTAFDWNPYTTKTALPSVVANQIIDCKFPFPPLQEQEAIANFLDEKCAEIDGLLADLEEQIKTLRAYEKSLIAETVTHGLNPNAQMKQSGIPWAETIPTHWNVVANKYLMHKQKDIVPVYAGQDIISLSMQGVIVRDLDAGGKMPTSFNGYQQIYPGNLLMCLFDIDVTPRCIGLIKNKGLTSPAYSQFVMKDGAYAPYYYYFYLKMDNSKELVYLSKNMRHSINEEQFGMIKTIQPPYEEQIAIANYLDDKIARIEDLIGDKFLQTLHLKEYKSSLIYEYVTGKKQLAL